MAKPIYRIPLYILRDGKKEGMQIKIKQAV
jgi:hypothetical protein